MSIKFTKRAAAGLLDRGLGSIRIKESEQEAAAKAITKDDVRDLIKRGAVYALKEKRNLSLHGRAHEIKKRKGRGLGRGSRKGTAKARAGVPYKQRIRAQRRLIKKIKSEGKINNEQFKMLYALVKGGTFASKITLINRIKSEGIQISDEALEKLRHI
jgi:large subunit ribosomal protein L19e